MEREKKPQENPKRKNLLQKILEEYRRQDDQISKQDDRISKQDDRISKQEERVSKQDDQISKQEERVSKQDDQISKQDNRISTLEQEWERTPEEIKLLKKLWKLLDTSHGNGEGPPNDPPQYLFDLLKQETEQLWQRSIMLLTIFAGIFAAYGQIILPIFSEVNKAYALTAQHHFFAALVALVGVIFSLIWIAVGKGAHYWYLKYYVVLENEYNKNHNPKEISYFNLPPIAVNDCLLSLKPGRYSLSRSQIAIGAVILFIWLAIFVTHTIQFVVNDGLGWIQKLIDWNQRWITLGGIALTFWIIYILISLKHEGDYDYPSEITEEINKISDELKALKQTTTQEKIKELVKKNQPNIKKYFEDEEKLNKLVEYLYNKYNKI